MIVGIEKKFLIYIAISLIVHSLLFIKIPNINQQIESTVKFEAKILPISKNKEKSQPIEEKLIKTFEDKKQEEVIQKTKEILIKKQSNRSIKKVQRKERTIKYFLSKHLFYPPEAIAEHLQGQVKIILVIGENGLLIDSSIAISSGYPILDSAALSAVRAFGKFDEPPGEILLPVTFKIN